MKHYKVFQPHTHHLVISGVLRHKVTKNHLATLQPSSHGKFLIFLKRLQSDEQLWPVFQLHREGN